MGQVYTSLQVATRMVATSEFYSSAGDAVGVFKTLLTEQFLYQYNSCNSLEHRLFKLFYCNPQQEPHFALKLIIPMCYRSKKNCSLGSFI